MVSGLAVALVLAGAALLGSALGPARQLVADLPPGLVRRRWRILALVIAAFILGYLGYLALFWGRHAGWADLLVPAIFLLGGCFVWMTLRLALQTAIDIRRVTVLEQENITDPLLGVYNRRYLDRRLEQEVARARRYGLPLAVLLLDIDHFKRVNDTHGHPAGDQVLSYLGQLIRSSVREADVAARYGGEELLIIAPNTTPAAAGVLAERIRGHVEAHALVLTNQAGQRLELQITVSVGVAGLSPQTTDGPALVGRADAALYRAKQDGRNRVVVEVEG
jgi:diguanylate cyclase (GGDEF)-like protein